MHETPGSRRISGGDSAPGLFACRAAFYLFLISGQLAQSASPHMFSPSTISKKPSCACAGRARVSARAAGPRRGALAGARGTAGAGRRTMPQEEPHEFFTV